MSTAVCGTGSNKILLIQNADPATQQRPYSDCALYSVEQKCFLGFGSYNFNERLFYRSAKCKLYVLNGMTIVIFVMHRLLG
jgi:hypothetical protein